MEGFKATVVTQSNSLQSYLFDQILPELDKTACPEELEGSACPEELEGSACPEELDKSIEYGGLAALLSLSLQASRKQN